MNKFFHRDIENKILKFVDRSEIIIIRGPRQAGKTTLMQMLDSTIHTKKLFVNLDIAQNRKPISESPIDYVKKILHNNKKVVLFLDEIQRLDNAGENLKIFYDTFKGKLKIFASGSSSLELRTKILSFLVGRAILFDLYTFSFGEFIRAKDENLYLIFKEKHTSLINFIEFGKKINSPGFSDDFIELWKEYAVFGGYPEIIKAKDKKLKQILLYNLIDLFIEKDIASFFKIEDTGEFENFMKIIALNDSQLFIASNIAGNINLTAYKINSYLNIIENTYIIKHVYPYYKNISTSIKKMSKIYFLDLGLRNALLKNLLKYDNRDDSGKLAENFVFIELLKLGYEINYWRTKSGAEMDFVIHTNNGQIIPIEVKLSGSKALGKSFYSFLNEFKPEKALVITFNEFFEMQLNKTKIYFIPIFYL